MNLGKALTTRRMLGIASGLALAVTLGSCGDEGPTGVVTPTTTPAPTPTPTPAPTPTPPPAVSGFWDSEARRWHFRLEQQGTMITGALLGFRDVYYSNPEDPDLQITGSLVGSQIDFHANAFGTNFSGTVQPGGLRMTGTLRDCANGCRNYGDELVKAP
ncbi:MAG TPA: hypothetical protein VGQ06_04625 [Gemmatimonadales bacterium]|nr:hypothetical protein [Gemmatimonadales bacterium]